MGIATDAQICFGFLLKEDQAERDDDIECNWDCSELNYPWDCEKYGYDFEDYWRKQNGFNLPEPGTDEDYNEKEWEMFLQERKEFDKKNPCFFELINACCESEPIYILAIPELTQIVRRGYPETINFKMLKSDTTKEATLLIEFCKKHSLLTETPAPQWYLSSFWEC